MLNFEFHNPTRIVFGRDQLDALQRLVPQGARLLITFGGGSARRSGLLDKVKAGLVGHEVFEFGGIEPNPRYSTLCRAMDVALAEKIDFILAVGGGSVIDGTKFISLAAHYGGDRTELLRKGNWGISAELTPHIVPFGAVLTLPATGSEMNSGAIISHDGGKYPVRSTLTYPVFSILDPTYTFTLPQIQVANGVIDAFVHVTEQYLTYPVDARLQDRWAEGVLLTLVEIGETTVNEPGNYDARANLMWCATMALNGLLRSGVPGDWATHMIGHELTARFGIDHAQTLAAVLPALLTELKEQKLDKLAQYAERVWGVTDGDKQTKADAAIARTRAFFESLGVPTRLSAHGVQAGQLPHIAQQLRDHGMTALSETRQVTPEVALKILEAAL